MATDMFIPVKMQLTQEDMDNLQFVREHLQVKEEAAAVSRSLAYMKSFIEMAQEGRLIAEDSKGNQSTIELL